MALVMRQSIIAVKPGKRQEVEKLFDAFEEHASKQKGYILGYRYTIPEQPDVLAHVDIWASPEVLGSSVIQDHVMYLRSQLLTLSDKEQNSEKQYVIHSTTKNFPKPSIQ